VTLNRVAGLYLGAELAIVFVRHYQLHFGVLWSKGWYGYTTQALTHTTMHGDATLIGTKTRTLYLKTTLATVIQIELLDNMSLGHLYSLGH